MIAVLLWMNLGSVGGERRDRVLIIPQSGDYDVPNQLAELGMVRNPTAFRWFFTVWAPGVSVVPGGYRVHSEMSSWEIVKTLSKPPVFVWVSLREGLRKEQIGEIVGTTLGWTKEQEDEWNAYNADSPEYREGVYFPDTYLLPSDEPVDAVAKRFVDRFNQVIGPYLPEFEAANIKWTTAVNIASLIERESGGDSDKALIAGIIWKRLGIGMRLEIDATLQYIKGTSEGGWWQRVVPADKYQESPYNTYRHEGLPPGPISNPGLKAMLAVLHPAETDCIFYLHSPDKEIHCAVTYDEHLENIDIYLR